MPPSRIYFRLCPALVVGHFEMDKNLVYTESLCNSVFDLGVIEDVLFKEDMEWAKPQYSRQEVNWAGSYLVSDVEVKEDEFDHAIDIVNNFRVAHAFPLNTLQNRLRIHAHNIDRNSIVAQRLKRLSSIWTKLERFPQMELWDMQDIGGCRAVVSTLDDIEKLVKTFTSSSIRHKLSHEDNYVQQPRDSGYRSRHLIYRYISDRNEVYNGLKVEIQIRTPLQHAWATTVETVDAFTQQALKSSRGRRDWERFFQLMGTEMAFSEGTPPVIGTPINRQELRQELKNCADELQVITSLKGFATTLQITQRASAIAKDADYFLLSLDNFAERLSITGYRRRELRQASQAYAKKEKEIRGKIGKDAVLVSVDSIRNLQRAYPNYFADTGIFVKALEEALKR
jgi:ppGpp synthetase/RelA/SpoT-type nucleotidyltranferase